MRCSLFLLASIASIGVVAACSGSNSASPGASGGQANIDNICNSYCAALEKCDSKVDDTTCKNQCRNGLAQYATHWRADFVQGFTDCIATDDCADVKALGPNCSNKAKASIAPTQAAQDFCSKAADKAKSCSSTANPDVAKCLDDVKTIDDASLAAATDCLSKACDQYGKCAYAAVGINF